MAVPEEGKSSLSKIFPFRAVETLWPQFLCWCHLLCPEPQAGSHEEFVLQLSSKENTEHHEICSVLEPFNETMETQLLLSTDLK